MPDTYLVRKEFKLPEMKNEFFKECNVLSNIRRAPNE
jgi:hypothetical protein